MPTPWQRDLDKDAAQLRGWLAARLPDASGVAVTGLSAPQSSGFSNDTLLFDLAYEQDGKRHMESLVVRIEPTGYQVFPEYDVGLQFRIMQKLAETDVPVPKMFWLEEEDRDLLGAPFYVMERVEGRVPSDSPPYHAGGWMTEITPAERAAIWWGGIESLARIHRVDHHALGFGFLDKPELGSTGLAQQLAYYEHYFEWAARGRAHPTVESALRWLSENQPANEPDVLMWGDARIGNIIFAGTRPAAVIDWEMAGHASPEADLAWTIFLDRHHSEGLERPRLEGFPSYEESVARYEELSGHSIHHLHYYQVFAGFRFGVIMMRLAQQLVTYEVMPKDAGLAFEIDNMVTRLLASLLELPPPSESL